MGDLGNDEVGESFLDNVTEPPVHLLRDRVQRGINFISFRDWKNVRVGKKAAENDVSVFLASSQRVLERDLADGDMFTLQKISGRTGNETRAGAGPGDQFDGFETSWQREFLSGKRNLVEKRPGDLLVWRAGRRTWRAETKKE